MTQCGSSQKATHCSPPGFTRRLISEFARILPPAAVPLPSSLAALTPRETEVLRLVAEGLSNSEIAKPASP